MTKTLIGFGAFGLGLFTGLALFMPHDTYTFRLFQRGDSDRLPEEWKPRYREWKGGVEQ